MSKSRKSTSKSKSKSATKSATKSKSKSFILDKNTKIEMIELLNFMIDNEMMLKKNNDCYKYIPDSCFLKVKHIKDILKNNKSIDIVDPNVIIYKLDKNDFMFTEVDENNEIFELGYFDSISSNKDNLYEKRKDDDRVASGTGLDEWLLANKQLYNFLKTYSKENKSLSKKNTSINKSKKSRKVIGSKAMKSFNKNLKSELARSKKHKTHKSAVLNRSQRSKPNNLYRYRIMSTVFKNGRTNYYDKFIDNVIPNLIIELEPKQDIIISDNMLKYINETLTKKVIKNDHLSNVSMFAKTLKLIKFSQVTNNTNSNASLCLKPKLPCSVEVLNINPEKSYTINPLNILGYSTNVNFSLNNKGFKISKVLFNCLFNLIFIAIGIFIGFSVIRSSKQFTFKMLDVKSENNNKGVVFLSSFGRVVKHKLEKNMPLNIKLGQLIAYDSTIKVNSVRSLILPKNKEKFNNPNLHGIPLNYYIQLKGEGMVYYQLFDYFDYGYNQLGMFDKEWLKQQKNK